MLKRSLSFFTTHSHKRLLIAVSLLLVVVLVLVVERVLSAFFLHRHTIEKATRLVTTITATASSSEEEVVLPGNVAAWHEASIYARTDGYVAHWYVDIGAHVTAKQLLATIDTPELDAQYRQAQADLKVSIAQEKLAASTAKRWVDLAKSESVSQQETDEKVSSAEALTAAVAAAQAKVNRLQELVAFEHVTAPFDGIISERATDIGALIHSDNTSGAKPLFKIVQANPLRVYVKIPQNYASMLKPHMVVSLQFSEHPGQSFSAKLLETAQSIHPVTRTLLAQFVVDNTKGALLAGSYAEVHFKMPAHANTVFLPINTIIFRKEGLQVAAVDNHNRVQLKSITISRDFGRRVEIRSGINPGERIILNPSDALSNGELVHVIVKSKPH